jgi:guanine deaminase
LDAAGALAVEHPDCLIQTHLSESRDEIALATGLYPEARDYLDIYESRGLLGPRTLLGHCIHLEDREVAALGETGAHPVFCPTSNLFLGSGLFDDARLRAVVVQSAIATDIGAGTSFSMLQTLNEGYKILQLQSQSLHVDAERSKVVHDLLFTGNVSLLGRVGRPGVPRESTNATGDRMITDGKLAVLSIP